MLRRLWQLISSWFCCLSSATENVTGNNVLIRVHGNNTLSANWFPYNGMSVRAITDWNALPNDIAEANSMVNFRNV